MGYPLQVGKLLLRCVRCGVPRFLANQNFCSANELPYEEYARDGTPITTTHSVALAAANAATASAASDTPERAALIEALWDLPVPTGDQRYYDGLLYLLALGAASGAFVPY